MGPTIYLWIRVAGIMWPRTDIKSSLCKALTEQVAYDPFAISSFLFCMTLMEGRTQQEAKQEVSFYYKFDSTRIESNRFNSIQLVSIHSNTQ